MRQHKPGAEATQTREKSGDGGQNTKAALNWRSAGGKFRKSWGAADVDMMAEKQIEIYPFHKHEVPYEHREVQFRVMMEVLKG